MTETTFPVVEPPFDTGTAEPTVTGVVLAAGTSSRFGRENKLLAPVDGRPLVCHAVEPLVETLGQVTVVVGYEADAVREALSEYRTVCVGNPDYRAGQATSVRAGLEGLPVDVDGVVFALGDMPSVSARTVENLCDAFAADRGDPVVASFDGRRGNPVLFGQQHFPALRQLSGDTGAKPILQRASDTVLVATDDPGVRRDVDTPSEL